MYSRKHNLLVFIVDSLEAVGLSTITEGLLQ